MMRYATGANSALKGMKFSEAQAVTSHSTMDHRDEDKASKAMTHHGNAQDNRSPRWKEEDQRTGWGGNPGGIQRHKNERKHSKNCTPSREN